jgi:putative DNA primase/helicase
MAGLSKQAWECLQGALGYATRGWPVLAVQPGGKVPLVSDWPRQATTDAEIIRNWFDQFPNAGVGIVTGPASGLVVLDIDGPRGEETLTTLEQQYGKLPPTYAVRTGGGGRHLYFRYPPDQLVRNSAGLIGPGLDIRADGGFVVAPPSAHQSGNRYLWVMNGQHAPAVFPDWLLATIFGQPKLKSTPGDGAGRIHQGERNTTLTSLAGSMRRCGMTSDAIEAALLAENQVSCDPPLAELEVQRIAVSVGRYQPARHGGTSVATTEEVPSAETVAWPDLASLGEELPPVPVLELELLPSSLRPLIEDVSERMQAPAEYAAAATVVSLAGCVGRRALIQPKVRDTWQVVPNLWGGIIAPPGFMKSPMLRAITLPLTHIEANWREEYESERADFEMEKEQAEIHHQAWKEEAKRSIKRGVALPVQPDKTLSVPAQRRLVLTDATFEKLHEILAQNSAGVLVIRDELTGWLAELDRLGREGERAFFLQAWNGDSGFTVDRIGRGSIYVPAVCVSLLGNIQPARLRWYLEQAFKGGPSDDGLFQRFQIMVWPDPPRVWRLVDRPPNQDALQTAERLFSNLVRLSAEDPLLMHFSPNAQELFFVWWAELEKKIRDGVGLPPVLVAHQAKYRSLMPALAGLFRLADWGATDRGLEEARIITLDDARRAAAWCDFLEAHARRVYSCAITPELHSAHELARHLQSGDLASPFRTRAVYLKGWTSLDTPERVRAALDLLEESGWVRPMPNEQSAKGGRPSELWVVNPKVGAK